MISAIALLLPNQVSVKTSSGRTMDDRQMYTFAYRPLFYHLKFLPKLDSVSLTSRQNREMLMLDALINASVCPG